MVVTIILVLGTAVRAEAQGCRGMTVTKVEVDGCGDSRCGHPRVHERLVSLTDLMGAMWTMPKAIRAEARLSQTGYFLGLTSTCMPVDGVNATVSFHVVPNRFIRKTEVMGTRTVFSGELVRRLFLRRGAKFNPEQRASKERLGRQVANLTSYLQQEGFDTASVSARVKKVGNDQVDLTFIVDEGKVSRITRVKVKVEGPWDDDEVPPRYSCPKLRKRDLLKVIKPDRGDLYTGRTARTVKRDLRNFLQQYGFQSPRIRTSHNAETGVLLVRVKVKTCFSIRVFEREEKRPHDQGFELLTEPELYEALPFKESGVFDDREAQMGVHELMVYYKTRGYLFTDVQMQFVDYRRQIRDWPYPLVGGVVYRVTRGQPTEIREIRILGNREFVDEELLTIMRTKRYDFFDVGGYLEVEQLFADLDLIKKHYQEQGFFQMSYPRSSGKDAQVRLQQIRKEDYTIWRYHWLDKSFDLIKPDWENAVRVELELEEGEGSRVRQVRLDGVTAFLPHEILERLPIVAGGPFSPKLVRTTVAEMESAYHETGRSATIEVGCRAFGPDVSYQDCKVEELNSLRVDLTFTVTEGPPLIMGEIMVVGNLETSRSVIVRDLPEEGDPFDPEKIDEAIRLVRSLGVFSAIRVEFVGLDEEPPRKRIAVVVQVEEIGTRFLELSAGFQKVPEREGEELEAMSASAADILTNSLHNTGAPLTGGANLRSLAFPDVLMLGEFSYMDRNFLGRAKSLQVPVSYGLTTKHPLKYAAFTPTYYDSRFLSTNIALRLTPLILYDFVLSRVDKFEYGVETELSYLVAKGIHLSLTNRLTRTSWKMPEEQDFNPRQLEASVTPAIRFDWRDNPINPTSGTYILAKVKYLNAHEQTIQTDGTLLVKRENFLKYELQTQFYLSLRKTVTLAFNGRYGHRYSADGGLLPPNHKFYLGGTSGVRGFPSRGVLQYEPDGDPKKVVDPSTTDWMVVTGGDTMINGTVELRFPLLKMSGLWAAAFFDLGALSDNLGDLYLSSFRSTAGLGVRFLLGDQIPVRLDYGFLLDRRCNAVDEASGECVSHDEPGALDFGLLYTF